LADSELKLGIDLFAGKSEITEGCSDFREIGDLGDLPGISDVGLSTCGAAELRCCCGRSVGLALLVCIRSTSRADPVQAVTAASGFAIWRHQSRRLRWRR
jgi:hypothetical protein